MLEMVRKFSVQPFKFRLHVPEMRARLIPVGLLAVGPQAVIPGRENFVPILVYDFQPGRNCGNFLSEFRAALLILVAIRG